MFALDTNLLMFPGTRRLFMGIAHDTNQQIAILPQVHRELFENFNFAKAEVRRWSKKIQRQGLVYKQSNAHRSAAQYGIREWLNERFYTDPHVTPLTMSEEDMVAAKDIAEALPNEAFSGVDTHADRQLIGEAIVLNIQLLGSKESSTIIHDELNRWAYHRGYNQKLIYSPSEIVMALCEDDMEIACQWVIAFNMNETDLSERDAAQEFVKTIETVGKMGFNEKLDPVRTLQSKLKVHLERHTNFYETYTLAMRYHRTSRNKVIENEYALIQNTNTHLLPFERTVDQGASQL